MSSRARARIRPCGGPHRFELVEGLDVLAVEVGLVAHDRRHVVVAGEEAALVAPANAIFVNAMLPVAQKSAFNFVD